MDPIQVIYSTYQMKLAMCWIFLAMFLVSAVLCIINIQKHKYHASDSTAVALVIGAICCVLVVVTMMGMNPSQDLIRTIAIMNATVCQ